LDNVDGSFKGLSLSRKQSINLTVQFASKHRLKNFTAVYGLNHVFIFQAGSGLNITNANIVLIGGLTPANVFWQVGSSAVLTAPVISFEGTIVALTSISMTNPVTMTGRALARNGAVTFDTDTVTVP